jgi:hypothetical protein
MLFQPFGGLLCSVLVVLAAQDAAPGRVSFSAVATPVPVGQAFEVTVRVDRPTAADCERDVSVVGEFTHEQAEVPLRLKGYCASKDGSLFRVGFVPERAGEYSWRVVYQQGEFQRTGTGSVTVVRR